MIPWPIVFIEQPFDPSWNTTVHVQSVHWLILAHLHQNIHHGWWWRWSPLWWALGPAYLSPLWSLAYFSGAVRHVHQPILWNPVMSYTISERVVICLCFHFNRRTQKTCRDNIPGKMHDSRWPCLYFVCVFFLHMDHRPQIYISAHVSPNIFEKASCVIPCPGIPGRRTALSMAEKQKSYAPVIFTLS